MNEILLRDQSEVLGRAATLMEVGELVQAVHPQDLTSPLSVFVSVGGGDRGHYRKSCLLESIGEGRVLFTEFDENGFLRHSGREHHPVRSPCLLLGSLMVDNVFPAVRYIHETEGAGTSSYGYTSRISQIIMG